MDSLLRRLREIGLGEYEAKLYVALVKRHPASGYELARASGVPSSKVYEVLARLREKELVFVTDGVLEARDDGGEEFGADRLARLLSTCTGRSAAGIARRIERSVLDHRGDRADDDMAVVVLRASG